MRRRQRPDRHRYGSKGEYKSKTSDDSPLDQLISKAIGLAVIIGLGLLYFRGCQ